MVRNTIIALVAAITLAGAAAPAFAEHNDVFDDEVSPDMSDFTADRIIAELKQRGINATSVEKWNGLIRAFVTRPDGTQTMMLFKPDTLDPVLD